MRCKSPKEDEDSDDENLFNDQHVFMSNIVSFGSQVSLFSNNYDYNYNELHDDFQQLLHDLQKLDIAHRKLKKDFKEL